jgi:diguanylate cyclase (GGDEF)-like protein/PAS domain S-box-containing protein
MLKRMNWDFDVVLANIPAVLFRGYADGSIDLFDRKVEAMTGYTKEEFETRQRKWTDLILETDRGSARGAFVDALRAGKAYTREYRIGAKAGNHVWVHERSHIVCDPDGRIEYVTGLFFDITERKNLEQSLHRAEQDFRIVVDNIPAVTFKGYIDGTIDLFDGKVEALIGHSRASFGPHGMKWTDLIWKEDREATRRAFIQALRTNRAYVREYRVRSADGRPVWIHERSHIVCDSTGRVEYISGLFFDITERKELEATVAERTMELQHANDRLMLWGKELEHRNAEINLLGQMGDLLQSCNTSAEAHTGFQVFAKQLFPEDSGTLFVFGESARLVEAVAAWGDKPPGESVFSPDDCWGLRRGRIHGRTDIEAGLRCRHVVDGRAAYLCVPMMAHGAALGVLHLLLASPDPERWDARQHLGARVGEHLGLALAKLKLQETLQHLSVRDPLTGLFNRRYMEESLTRELRRAERQGRQLGILMVDIDHFKSFNDTFGHDAGDALLRELGAFLQRGIRAGDIACRYGGEEFTIVLQDASQETTRQRAEEIREAAKQLQVHHGQRVLDSVTLSLGAATFPQNGTSRDILMQSADVALYRAKQEGRDRVCMAENR